MKVKVTQAHISAGKPLNPCDCPVSLAIAEVIGERVIVSSRSVGRFKDPRVIHSDDNLVFPLEVQEFIDEFDAGEMVSPMEFDLPGLDVWMNDKPVATTHDDTD